MSNLFGVGGGLKIYKNGLAMGVTIGGDVAKTGNNNHLLVMMFVMLSQKIGMIDLTSQTQFKRGNGYKIGTKSVRDYCALRLMLHTISYYYRHTNVDLLEGVNVHSNKIDS